MPTEYVSTPVAAKALGIGKTTLGVWAREGKVTPAWITQGGQYRWDLEDLRRQLGIRKQK